MLESEYIKDKYPGLYDSSIKIFINNYDSIMKNLEKHKNTPPHIISTRVYNMQTSINYQKTRLDIERLYKQLKN